MRGVIWLRAGMLASRLNHRERNIPALTDHLEDEGGVIGPAIVILFAATDRHPAGAFRVTWRDSLMPQSRFTLCG
jgi:hypothetical protein